MMSGSLAPRLRYPPLWMAQQSLKEHLGHIPLFPLPDAVLFPTMRLPLHIFEPRYRQMVHDAQVQGLPIAIGHMKSSTVSAAGQPGVFPVAGAGFIDALEELPDGRFLIVLLGQQRIRIVEERPSSHPYRVVVGELVFDSTISEADNRRALEEVQRVILAMHQREPLVASTLSGAMRDRTQAGEVADIIAALVHTDPMLRQAWLEEQDPALRLHAVTEALETLLVLSRARPTALN